MDIEKIAALAKKAQELHKQIDVLEKYSSNFREGEEYFVDHLDWRFCSGVSGHAVARGTIAKKLETMLPSLLREGLEDMKKELSVVMAELTKAFQEQCVVNTQHSTV